MVMREVISWLLTLHHLQQVMVLVSAEELFSVVMQVLDKQPLLTGHLLKVLKKMVPIMMFPLLWHLLLGLVAPAQKNYESVAEAACGLERHL